MSKYSVACTVNLLDVRHSRRDPVNWRRHDTVVYEGDTVEEILEQMEAHPVPEGVEAASMSLKGSINLLGERKAGFKKSLSLSTLTAIQEHPANIKPSPKIGLVVSGGIVQSYFSDVPLDVYVIDYDTESIIGDDPSLTDMGRGNGRAYFYKDKADILPEEIQYLDELIAKGGGAK